jgi:predicted NBD/HSP70 family sugar kinase
VGGAEVVDLTRTVATRNGDTQLLDSLAGLNDSDALEVVITAVQHGAPSAVEAVSAVARRLVAGIAAVRALLDPELVIVGGPMARCGGILLEVMEQSRASQILNQPELELSSLGDDAVLFGAIHHSLADVEQRYFTPQALTEGLPASTAG